MSNHTAIKIGFEALVRQRGNFTVRMVQDDALRRFEIIPYLAWAALALLGYPLAFLIHSILGLPLLTALWSVFVFWMIFVFRQYFVAGPVRWSAEVERDGGKVVFSRAWTMFFILTPLIAGLAGVFQSHLTPP